ncbi:MAG: hypothetical protein SGI92_20740 [Bryobacteraceae bacterium]|nr:hypothetical protein [Bryobacteraceae bacterium]
MVPSQRSRFNQNWTEAKYQNFLRLLEARVGEPTRFRHSETPVFLPLGLIQSMETAGREIVGQLLNDPLYEAASARAIPPRYRVPNEAPSPLFVQADFGLDENMQPRLVEIQGFPSLYAYQPVMAECYREAFELNSPFTFPANYNQLLGQAILSDKDPKNVVLLEVDPENQKTFCDFAITRRDFGVEPVDITRVVKKGNKLYKPDGITPIHRIYNRAIIDEIQRKDLQLPFEWTDDLDVEWAGHPNWYFRLSKFSLPYLKHPTVPETIPAQPVPDPQNWVLKPLWSFAGLGVIVGPTAAQIAAATPAEDYILQRRVNFHPFIDTPYGPTKAEIRVMYIDMQPVNIIMRMGRGAQMGVDHNKGLKWIGASAAFIGE